MAEIRSIEALRANKAGDNTIISPLATLEDAAEDIRQNVLKCDKLMVIAQNTETGLVSFYASSMSIYEMITMLELMKFSHIKTVGGGLTK